MPATPEVQAREGIDRLLMAAGWHDCGVKDADILVAQGMAIREFPLAEGYGFADYLLCVDGKVAGVILAKKVGTTLTGAEVQSVRYAKGLPASLPSRHQPLPFVIKTKVFKVGSKVGTGCWLHALDKPTSVRRDCQLNDDPRRTMKHPLDQTTTTSLESLLRAEVLPT